MLKIFSRIIRDRKSPRFGHVDNQIRDVKPPDPAFSTVQLTGMYYCIVPVLVDGVETVCGADTTDVSGAHGWFCHHHLMLSTVRHRVSPAEALRRLDADNIQFILGQDKLNRAINGEQPLGPYRGWEPQPDKHAPDTGDDWRLDAYPEETIH